MRVGTWFAAVAVAVGLGTGCGEEASAPRREESPETRALMGRIYEGLRVALPESVREEPFSDPARRADVAAALDLLAANADLLAAHADDDAVTAYLARSIARDAQQVREEYARGRYERSGFLLQQITENCVACHSRLPDPKDRPLARGFVDEASLAELSLEQRAGLQIATRRFDDALDTLERVLASPESPVLMLDTLVDYLVVSIRVKGDFERPMPVLERFAKRPDLWEKLRRDVDYWISVLPELHRRAEGEPRLEVARAIMDEARDAGRFPGGHRAVAHYVVASSILERFVHTHGERDVAMAEAYYRLGLIEAWIGRNYWVTSAPFLLESAIRIAPHAPFSADAYAILEEETILSYEGADEEIPREEREHLDELHALIETP